MKQYYQPIVGTGTARPASAYDLAGGWCWFDRVVVKSRDAADQIVAADDLPKDVLAKLTQGRADLMGLSMAAPQIMGIINATPDSFSDGNLHNTVLAAMARIRQMIADGVTIIDIGGESTRPGAITVPDKSEAGRVGPIACALRAESDVAISVDTRKAGVIVGVGAALRDIGGASRWMLNDVSAMSYDPLMAEIAQLEDIPVCLMHAQGDPRTMQNDPTYDDVLLDVYDYLEDRLDVAVAAGIPRNQIVIDPGIGFGKTLVHNVILLQNLSLFHALGVPVLLGASRKRFIGTLTKVDAAQDRVAGSVAVALHALSQGVQIVRVHDTAETAQAFRMHAALNERF